MTVSINATMSLVSVLSDDHEHTRSTQGMTNDFQTAQPIPTRIRGWPTPSGATVDTPSSATQYSVLDQTILSDLASSRAEVEALKIQVTQLVAQRESQTQQIVEAVHAQVARALAFQQSTPPPALATSIDQDQLTDFLKSQDQKFDAMSSMFREMMTQNLRKPASGAVPADDSSPLPPGPTGTSTDAGNNATKRTTTADLEEIMESNNNGMEVDSELSRSSHKRNDARPSPVKTSVQLFPLFKYDTRNKKSFETFSEERFQPMCDSHPVRCRRHTIPHHS
jgi:hypothetical protein